MRTPWSNSHRNPNIPRPAFHGPTTDALPCACMVSHCLLHDQAHGCSEGKQRPCCSLCHRGHSHALLAQGAPPHPQAPHFWSQTNRQGASSLTFATSAYCLENGKGTVLPGPKGHTQSPLRSLCYVTLDNFVQEAPVWVGPGMGMVSVQSCAQARHHCS